MVDKISFNLKSMSVSDITNIILALCAIAGVIYSHLNLKSKIKKTDSIINSIIINKSKGPIFNGCVFNNAKNDNEIKDQYLGNLKIDI